MNKLLYVIVAVVALAAGAFIYHGINQKESPKHALYYETPRAIKPFTLTDHNGSTFSKEVNKGSVPSYPDYVPPYLEEQIL